MAKTAMSRYRLWMIFLPVFVISARMMSAEIIYVDAVSGNDGNPGTREKPLGTLNRAAALVNASEEPGPTQIRLEPGIYLIQQTILIKNRRAYSEKSRLILQASTLPGDPGWSSSSMPILISIQPQPVHKKPGEYLETYGLQIEIEHVTIRGLRFLGSPTSGVLHYPISRLGKDLHDLVVMQCVFSHDPNSMTSNVCILVNGHGLIVDHCVFYNIRNPVVFWRAEGGKSAGNAMRYCIVDGATTSAIWVCDTAEDLDFHHNVITRCRYAWMRDAENRHTYSLRDSVITDCQSYSGRSTPSFSLSDTDDTVAYRETNIVKKGVVKLVRTEGIDLNLPNNHLHIAKGDLGGELEAGLFIR